MPPRGEWVSLNGPWANEASVAGYRLHEDRRHWQHTGQPFLIQRSRTPGFLTATLRLLGFHVANVVFAVIGSGVLSAGICAAVSLLPMCCVGLLLFQVIVYIVFALAQWDITLSNYIAPAHQRASPNLSPHRGLMGRHEFSGHRIASGLTHFSPLSLMAMLYFVWVKPVIGLLSLLAVLLVTSPVTSFITLLLRGDINWMEIYGVDTMTLSRNRVVSLVGAIIVTLVGIALMQLVAKISRQATQFFCCENFTVTSRFHGRYPFRSIGQQHVMGSYGAVSS
ncbi:hypothetical protein PHYBOEH_006753 [Phytophthora boehmeriae]|uniref:Sensor domain-containing protein n=1 Tax=Phytophthora boehmeriae TaxID=109152 RepID=A0A8T1WHB0_9STRA|nr:hypothetical protein PHYBOEH_006753 [Phytophthora boehmeriae]